MPRWRRPGSGSASSALAPDDVPAHWSQLMTPWPEPHSAADGILDDETYDWLAVIDVMRRSGGSPVVVPETAIARAHELGRTHRHPRQRHRHRGPRRPPPPDRPPPTTRTAVIFSGVDRF